MDPAEAVRRIRSPETHEEFRHRVAAQADRLRASLADGEFEGAYAVGLELEGYAVDADDRLARIPKRAPEGAQTGWSQTGRGGNLYQPIDPSFFEAHPCPERQYPRP